MADQFAHIPIDDHFGIGDDDSTYGDNDLASETTSLKSAISYHYYQHGRRYHAYHAGSYWGPNDAQSADQLDIGHHVFTLALDGKLFLAPIGDHPQKILDVGTGTGIWAIDIADQFPSAQVIGTDLSPIQPREVPPNLQFEIDDFCTEWTYTKNSFDFIHGRGLYGCVGDYAAYYGQVYDHLKPGGWYEQFETGVVIKTDDGTFDDDSIFAQWGRVSLEAGDAFGKSLRTVDEAKDAMIAAGLENVVEHRYKLPIGGWSSDPKLKELGLYYRLFFEEGIELWTMYLLTNCLHWQKEEVEVYLAKMRQMLRDKSVHGYVEAMCVYGQKPMRYDDSYTDVSSYQSYETSAISSSLPGEKDKKVDISTAYGGFEGAPVQHADSPGFSNGVAVAGVAAMNRDGPSAEDQQKLPDQAFVDTSAGDHSKPDHSVKSVVGSPAGDSTYASPRAHITSPIESHEPVFPQRSDSLPAQAKAEEKTILQASKVDSAVGLPATSQIHTTVDVPGQPANVAAASAGAGAGAGTVIMDDRPSNDVQDSRGDERTSLFGGPTNSNLSGSMVENEGIHDRKETDGPFEYNNNFSIATNNMKSDNNQEGEATAHSNQKSANTMEASTGTSGMSPQPGSASAEAQVSNTIPALAQDPVSLPNQPQSLNFAGQPENDLLANYPLATATNTNNQIYQGNDVTARQGYNAATTPLPASNDGSSQDMSGGKGTAAAYQGGVSDGSFDTTQNAGGHAAASHTLDDVSGNSVSNNGSSNTKMMRHQAQPLPGMATDQNNKSS